MPSRGALRLFPKAPEDCRKNSKARHADIPWTDITGAGSAYRYGCEDALERILWHTLKRGLEPLRAVVEQELRGSETSWMKHR